MKPKLLIILLTILILLHFAGMGLVGSRASTSWFSAGINLEDSQWSQSIRPRLIQKLPPDKIINMWPSQCRQDETHVVISPGATCTATIRGENKTTRQLKLQIVQGNSVNVLLEQENTLTVDITLERVLGQVATTTPVDIYKSADLHDATLIFQDCKAEHETIVKDESEETSIEGKEPKQPPHCLLELMP